MGSLFSISFNNIALVIVINDKIVGDWQTFNEKWVRISFKPADQYYH